MATTLNKRLFPIFLLLLVACSTKSGQKASDASELFGNPELNQPLTEITFEEPVVENPDAALTDETTDDAEVFPCDQISILSSELDEAMAGDEYRFPFSIRSNCQQVGCSLVAAPEWAELNGCELNGIPASHEALGEHELRVRVFGHDHETTFEERTFTLTVRDEPSIALFTASPDLGEKMKKEISGANSKVENVYSITLGRHALYARIEGHADSYEVTLDGDDPKSVTFETVGEKLYRILPVENILTPNQEEFLLSDLNISAEDEFGNSAEKTFDLHIFENPCDDPLEIIPVYILKLDGASYTNRVGEIVPDSIAPGQYRGMKTDVILGTKYRILLKVEGGEGPYEWTNSSRVWPEVCPPDLLEYCHTYTLTSNENWEEVTPDDPDWTQGVPSAFEITPEEREQKKYFQLQTDFTFPDKDIPFYRWHNTQEPPQDVYDQLQITVTSPTCRDSTGTPQEAPYSLNHHFKLPADEGLGDIQCRQSIGEVGDTADQSRMWTFFKNNHRLLGSIEHKINDCKGEDKTECEELKRIGSSNYCEYEQAMEYAWQEEERTLDAPLCDQDWVHHGEPFDTSFGFIDTIDQVELAFADNAPYDNYCFDCEDYRADYDLIDLTCYTNYRSLHFRDGRGGNINGNVVGYHSNGHLREYGCIDDGCPWDFKIHPLLILPTEYGIWKPRTRPDYSDSN